MPVGRPTKYREEYVEQARKLCLLGATSQELADFFEVNYDTIHEWMRTRPEFDEAIRQGKTMADAEVAEKLFQRAKGYSHPDVHVTSYEGQVTLTDLVKYYPPDTQAASLWLRNRQPKKWRDRQELTGADGGPVATQVVYRWAEPEKE